MFKAFIINLTLNFSNNKINIMLGFGTWERQGHLWHQLWIRVFASWYVSLPGLPVWVYLCVICVSLSLGSKFLSNFVYISKNFYVLYFFVFSGNFFLNICLLMSGLVFFFFFFFFFFFTIISWLFLVGAYFDQTLNLFVFLFILTRKKVNYSIIVSHKPIAVFKTEIN